MSENSFYVSLPSNVTHNDVHENSMAQWMTSLHSWIHLDGDYEVGLAEFSYTYSWFNINTRQKIMICEIDGTCVEQQTEQYIEPGIYSDIDTLIQLILQKIDSFGVDWWRRPSIAIADSGYSIQVLPGEANQGRLLYVKFSDELSGILGLPAFAPKNAGSSTSIIHLMPKTKYSFSYDSGYHPVDLRGGIHSLFVYTDIIKHRYVGDTKAQLLRKVEIPSTTSFGSQINLIYERPHYHPIGSPSFCSIEIAVKDDTDSRINFRFGRCIAVLHFRRIKELDE